MITIRELIWLSNAITIRRELDETFLGFFANHGRGYLALRHSPWSNLLLLRSI